MLSKLRFSLTMITTWVILVQAATPQPPAACAPGGPASTRSEASRRLTIAVHAAEDLCMRGTTGWRIYVLLTVDRCLALRARLVADTWSPRLYHDGTSLPVGHPDERRR
jgi:hypothetical protein